MHVRDPGARRARRKLAQPFLRHVHGVDAAGAVHQHRQRERLAARARAEIGNHLAASRRDQVSEQLAALVLHFHRAGQKKRVAIDRGFSLQPDPGGGKRGGRAFERELRERVHPRELFQVYAQIERRRAKQ